MSKEQTAAAAMARRIEMWPIARLVPYAKNARTHSDTQIKQIVASINEFGFLNPILVDGEDGIIAGHGRLLAAKDLGMQTVPVVVLTHLTSEQKRAYVLADNQIALNAGWDNEMLRAELEALSLVDFDLSLLGWNDEELADLLPEVEELPPEDADADDVPEVPADPVTKPGDVWLLGKHRLMCGDSTSIENLEALTGGGVDMWLTDPPYNVAVQGGCHGDPNRTNGLRIKNDEMSDDAFRQFLSDAYTAASAVMKAGAVFYIWHADVEGYNFRGAAIDVGWKVRQCLIWKKQGLVLGRQDYHWKHESCLYGWKDGAGHLWAADRKQTTILEFDRPSRNGEHPTMKPVALFEYQMLNNTKGGDMVLDSFGGSGTTLIAAEKNGRRACLMELDPHYCDVIVKRWQNFTGKTATLEATGEPFPSDE